MKTAFQSLGIAALCITFAACSTTKESVAVSESQPEVQEQDTRDLAELEEMYWARKDSAKMIFVQADVDFMTGMIGHHAQALVMSALAPKNNAGSEVQRLASRIINAQKDEINIMQTWLYERGQPVPQVFIDGLMLTTKMGEEPLLEYYPEGKEMAMMTSEEHIKNHAEHMANGMHEQHQMEEGGDHADHDMGGDMDTMHESEPMEEMHGGMMHDHSTMPGMLSQAQLEELAAAKGKDFDQLFLRYMIQHHSGAITMVNDLVVVDGAMLELGVEKLAHDINVDQKTEIERMRLMLTTIMEEDAK